MRIIFIGTVDFSRSCLEAMLNMKANVVGIFTQKQEHARFNADWSDLSPLARTYHVPIFYFKKISDSVTLEEIRKLRPDVIFVLGLSQLLPGEFLRIPPMGVIGSHPALLPKNRGRHPLIWALVEGLKKSGLTLFYIDEGVDSGDIAMQREFEIAITNTAADLYRKVTRLGVEMLRKLIPLLEKGMAPRIPQDHNLATYWRKRTEKDGEIDWTAPTMKTYNLIRALTHPYVGAHTYYQGKRLLVWRSGFPEKPLASEALSLPSGTIISLYDAGFDIRTGDGYLPVMEYEIGGSGVLEVGTHLGGQP